MTQIVCFLFIREKCSTDINKKKMTQINKAQLKYAGTVGQISGIGLTLSPLFFSNNEE